MSEVMTEVETMRVKLAAFALIGSGQRELADGLMRLVDASAALAKRNVELANDNVDLATELELVKAQLADAHQALAARSGP